jgi:hypothetical protein
VAVEIRKIFANAAKIDEPINGAQQVILRNMILQLEIVEQRRLRFLPRSHHQQSIPKGRIEAATYTSIKKTFFNKIGSYLASTKFESTVVRQPLLVVLVMRPFKITHTEFGERALGMGIAAGDAAWGLVP